MSKKAEMYIKGMKDPISVDDFEAQAIEALLIDASKDNRSHISIEGVWSGTKGDVRFIRWSKEEPRTDYRNKIEAMSNTEARTFEQKILPFKLQAELSGFGNSTWPLFYMQYAGALRLEICETKRKKLELRQIVTDYIMYPRLQEEVESYYLYRAKVEYAKKMREKELEKEALSEEVAI